MKKQLFLILISIIVNVLFLYCYNPHYYYSVSQLHGQVGYNLCTAGTCNINPILTQHMGQRIAELNTLVDYDDVEIVREAPIVLSLSKGEWQPFPVNDTVGYGVVLGLLWKITDRFKFFDVQILHIILFSLLMPLAFACARTLFGSSRIAWWCCIAQLLFFPLVAMNVQPVRDIWAYYALILLLYGFLMYLFEQKSWWVLSVCALGFSLCQWVRPSVFAAFVSMCGVLMVYAALTPPLRTKIITAVGTCVLVTGLFFWIPFVTFNYAHYGRAFVGPVGQDLLEGLGEFENPWGFKLSDLFVDEYISKKYGSTYGTTQFDDDAKQEFLRAHRQQPWIFYSNIIRRVPQVIMPGLPWIYYENSPYPTGATIQQKLKLIFSSWSLFFDFLARHIYIRVLLLLGYAGIMYALIKKRYFAVALLCFGIMVGGWGKLPSHIEFRYLVPFYWVFAWFVGYAAFEFCSSRVFRRSFRRLIRA